MTDLVIGGGRRPSPHRTVRTIAIVAGLVAVLLLVSYFVYRRVVSYVHPDGSIPDAPLVVAADMPVGAGDAALTYGASALAHAGSVTVLRLVGDPHTVGAAHGRLLGGAVGDTAATFDELVSDTVGSGGLFGGLAHGMRVRWRYRMLDDGIPGHQLVEMAGVLRGADRTAGRAPGWETFVRHHAAIDVGAAPAWSFHAATRSLAFVTSLRGASGDRLLVGRSFALPGTRDGGETAAENVTVSFVRADDVIPYASVGWPGLVGVVSGINAEGIAVMVQPASTADLEVTRTAQPVTLLARDVLENARTLDDAIGILDAATPLGAASFLVVDGNARSWAVVERSPTQVFVHRDAGRVVGDLLTGKPFTDDPENDRARRTRPSAMRIARAERLLRSAPPATPADAVALLRDDRDREGAPLPAGHRGAVADVSAVHTAVFDASAMVLWVADGPGPHTAFRAFDLRHELRGEGARPAPPPDIPAGGHPATDVLAARRVVLAARDARDDGDRRRARELAERALARAPDLPEALVLAGRLARDAGDHDAASRYFERYLEVGPDDLGAEEEIRALVD